MSHATVRYKTVKMGSRREFLGMLTGLFVVANSACIFVSKSVTDDLIVRNFNGDGNYIITEGKTLLVEVSLPEEVESPVGSFSVKIETTQSVGAQLSEQQPLFFYRTLHPEKFRMFVTAPLDVVEGVYSANISKGERSEVFWSIKYAIRRGNYRESALTVHKDFSEPSSDILARMRQDFETTRDIYKGRSERSWAAPFIHPVTGLDRDNFGDKRIYNNSKHARHAGLDYKAPMGTPVSAINDGVVAFSDEQWAAGETICIDHGGGVFSRYIHLSKRNVLESDRVKRGEIIGLSGNSGGQRPVPHLHLNTVVNGVNVDPNDFMHRASDLLTLEAQEANQQFQLQPL